MVSVCIILSLFATLYYSDKMLEEMLNLLKILLGVETVIKRIPPDLPESSGIQQNTSMESSGFLSGWWNPEKSHTFQIP